MMEKGIERKDEIDIGIEVKKDMKVVNESGEK